MIPISRPVLGFREWRAVTRVLASGSLAQGKEVARFEEAFSDKLLEGRPTVAVNSGTSGLHLGLLASGLEEGDEVIVPAFTFAATANSIVLAGGTPVWCDISYDSFCIDPDQVESLVTPRTRAIMVVHMFGQPAPMEKILEIARRRNLTIFEDCAQAHGAKVGFRNVGTFGDWSMFSFYATKNMTTGEGGVVGFASESQAATARTLRSQGMDRAYHNSLVGFNLRMTEIQGALGYAQLHRLDQLTRLRRRNADFFNRRIELPTIPAVIDGTTHVYHQYTIRIPEDRDGFVAALEKEHGIRAGVYYPVPLNELESFRKHRGASNLLETNRACSEVVSLPVHPSLSLRNLRTISRAVNRLSQAGG